MLRPFFLLHRRIEGRTSPVPIGNSPGDDHDTNALNHRVHPQETKELEEVEGQYDVEVSEIISSLVEDRAPDAKCRRIRIKLIGARTTFRQWMFTYA